MVCPHMESAIACRRTRTNACKMYTSEMHDDHTDAAKQPGRAAGPWLLPSVLLRAVLRPVVACGCFVAVPATQHERSLHGLTLL